VELTLRNAALQTAAGTFRRADVSVVAGRVTVVAAPGTLRPAACDADLEGRLLLPGLVNAHDHLDLSTFPPLGSPPFADARGRAATIEGLVGSEAVRAALAPPPPDRLWLGGLRNLLCGATGVLHHGAWHRSLGGPEFPVRVQARYAFALSASLTEELRRTYRTTDRRIPWIVHAGEGQGDGPRRELDALERANVLRQNTVIARATAFGTAEAGRLAAARACVAWCPEAERWLFAATAAARILLDAGVRLGLGSDGADCGGRDLLSTLAAARAEGALDDAALIDLATTRSAEAARLAPCRFEPGDPADLVAVRSEAGLLAGDRRAISLVIVGGRPRLWEATLLNGPVPSATVRLDGEERILDRRTAARSRAILARHPRLAEHSLWLAGLRFA
jgi:cytosine/adenosine deaminase-related metal-dependent hydrolase